MDRSGRLRDAFRPLVAEQSGQDSVNRAQHGALGVSADLSAGGHTSVVGVSTASAVGGQVPVVAQAVSVSFVGGIEVGPHVITDPGVECTASGGDLVATPCVDPASVVCHVSQNSSTNFDTQQCDMVGFEREQARQLMHDGTSNPKPKLKNDTFSESSSSHVSGALGVRRAKSPAALLQGQSGPSVESVCDLDSVSAKPNMRAAGVASAKASSARLGHPTRPSLRSVSASDSSTFSVGGGLVAVGGDAVGFVASVRSGFVAVGGDAVGFVASEMARLNASNVVHVPIANADSVVDGDPLGHGGDLDSPNDIVNASNFESERSDVSSVVYVPTSLSRGVYDDVEYDRERLTKRPMAA